MTLLTGIMEMSICKQSLHQQLAGMRFTKTRRRYWMDGWLWIEPDGQL